MRRPQFLKGLITDVLLYISFIITPGQINDLAAKLETWDNNRSRSYIGDGNAASEKKIEEKLSKATKDSAKITTEVLQGLMSQVIKDKLFNHSTDVKAVTDGSDAK